MPNQNRLSLLTAIRWARWFLVAFPLLTTALFLTTGAQAHLKEQLKGSPFKIAYECYVNDYSTKGMSFYALATGRIEAHPNSTNLHHLYNPAFSPNGKWIVSTVHAGMGFDLAILAIEAHGNRIINLKIPGCRPCLSPDGRQIAWGSGDHEIVAAPIDLDSDSPSVGRWRLRICDKTNEAYHMDWSPDSRFLSLSRGPASKGDPTKTGTFQAACEIVGVYAPGWNLCAVPAERDGILDLNHATDADFLMLTTNGFSNKESAWFRPPRKTKE